MYTGLHLFYSTQPLPCYVRARDASLSPLTGSGVRAQDGRERRRAAANREPMHGASALEPRWDVEMLFYSRVHVCVFYAWLLYFSKMKIS